MTIETDAPPATEQTTAGPARWRRYAASFWGWPLVSALTGVVVVARALADFLGTYVPIGDVAMLEVRTMDVFTTHPPLLGMLSNASEDGRVVHHPGPILFYLMALPVRLFDHGRGLALGMGILSAACLIGVGVVAARFLGRRGALLAATVTALLVWSAGADYFHDAFPPHAVTAPFLLFLVSVWCLMAGDDRVLPVVVLAYSLSAQTHGSTFVVASGVLVVAIVFRAITDNSWQGSAALWAGSGVLAFVLWLPPLIQQFFGDGPGNLSQILLSAGDDRDAMGVVVGARAVASVLLSPWWWLRPGFARQLPAISGVSDTDGNPTVDVGQWGAGVSLLALGVVILLAIGVIAAARKRRDRTIEAGAALVIAVVVVGVTFIALVPVMHVFGLMVHVVRWLWPLCAVVTLVGLMTLGRWTAVGRWRRVDPAVVVVAALVAGSGAMLRSDNAGPQQVFRSHGALILDVRESLAALDDPGTVLVLPSRDMMMIDAISDGMVAELAERGVHYVVDDPYRLGQFDESHAFAGEADFVLTVEEITGPPAPGTVVVTTITDLAAPVGADAEAFQAATAGRSWRVVLVPFAA